LAGRNLVQERAAGGAIAMTWTAEGWREYLEAKAAAEGADLRIVVHEWKSGRAIAGAATDAHSISVPAAVEKYFTLRLAEDVKTGTDTYRHLDLHLRKRFGVRFKSNMLHEVTADDIRGWMNGLVNPDNGEPMGTVTKGHHRKNVNAFFDRAVMEEWVRSNPCLRVKAPSAKLEDEEDDNIAGRVIPVVDLEKLFRMNRDQPVVGRLALELFGGLRAASAERMLREHVNFEEKGLTLPGVLHKSGKRKYRTGHPEALWAWLRHAGERMWTEVDEGSYGYLKTQAFIRAGVTNPGNGLRHSFVSYHLALNRNMPLTSFLAQHRRSTTTEGYEGLATEADAKRWAAILP
jgi:integrase